MTQRVEKTDDYSSDEEKRTESEKSLALDAMDKPERTRGVLAMERLSERIGVNRIYLFLLYGGFALLAYILSLDQYTSGTYLTVATSVSFQAHSSLSTIRTVRSVFQAVSQPPIAALADNVGRVETYMLCVFLYTLGYIVVASSTSIIIYGIGNSIYILGITGLFLLQNIIISDISSLRNRIIWCIFPNLPGAINVWVSGDIAASMLGTLGNGGWRWGYGMFCILTPVLAIPIIVTLTIGMRETKTQLLARSKKPLNFSPSGIKRGVVNVFWKLDLVGLFLLVVGAGLFLVAITLANSRTARWYDASSITLLVVGGSGVIGFVLWEKYAAKFPLIPFSLLRNRTVIASLFIAVLHPTALSIASGFFYTFLVVAANQSVKSATRLSAIPGFASLVTAFLTGILARYTRRLKPIIIAGFCLEVLGLGLMIKFRTATNSQAEIAVVQAIRGMGVGMISFPVQAAIQSASTHDQTAAITAGYLTIYYLSSGIGSSIGGGIWTNSVPQKLNQYLTNQTLAAMAYANPIGFISTYAPGTPERMAVARAQDETQRIIVITATCIGCLALLASCFIENVRLPDTQSIEEEKRVGGEVEK